MHYADIDGTRYEYEVLDDNSAVLTLCTTQSSILVMPEDIDSHTISQLASGAIKNSPDLAAVVLPQEAKTLGRTIFEHCPHITSITLPKNVTEIGYLWFANLSQINEIVLPDNLPTFDIAILKRAKVRKIVIGANTREIICMAPLEPDTFEFSISPANHYLSCVDGAFYTYDHKVLQSIVYKRDSYKVLDGCERIGRKAFSEQYALEEVTLPETIRYIDEFAFLDCAIEAFVAPKNLKVIGAKAFLRASKLSSVTLNEGLEEIGDMAFMNTSISQLKLPSTLRSLGAAVAIETPLYEGVGKDRITIAPNDHYLIDDVCAIYEKMSAGLRLYDVAYLSCAHYDVLSGTTEVGPDACFYNKKLQTVTLPEGVVRICRQGFANCISLKHVDFPQSLRSVDERAFVKTALEHFELPAGFEHMEDSSFSVIRTDGSTKEFPMHGATVDAANERYFVDGGILYERKSNAKTKAILYVGPDPIVTVRRDTDEFGSFLFTGVTGIDELHLHDDVRYFDPHAFTVGRQVKYVYVTLTLEPLGDDNPIQAYFPNGSYNYPIFFGAFHSGRIDAHLILDQSDMVLHFEDDQFERYSRMVRRLHHGIPVEASHKKIFHDMVRQSVVTIGVLFCSRHYTEGLEELADMGYLTESLLSEVIEQVSAKKNVEMTGYLLEMKRRRFPQKMSYYDL